MSELARRVGIAKSTAHRTCAVLADRGLLDRTADGGYRLGLRFVEYGSLATERTAVRDRGLPLLVELRNKLGETVQIGVPAGADVVYVERVEGRRALRYSTNARRSPIHRSSCGQGARRVQPGVLEARLRAGLPPSTGYTIVVPEVLVAELAACAGAGLRPQRRRDRARDVVARRAGARARSTVRSWRRSRWSGPTARVVGDHEAHHAGVLQAAAASSPPRSRRATTALRRRP